MFDETINTLDLFCGAGGLSLGFETAGFNIVAGVDKEKKLLDTWSNNHSGQPVDKDISEITPTELVSEINDFEKQDIDMIIGGPPCKDFTKTNQKIDLGRNHLLYLTSKYIDEIQPDYFVIENVRQITTKHEDVLNDFLSNLNSDYDISYRLLDSADYGVPQHRIRAFIIGIKPDRLTIQDKPKFPKPTHGPDSKEQQELVTACQAIGDLKSPTDQEKYAVKSKHSHLLDDIPPGMNYSFYTEKMNHPEPKFDWRSRFSDYLYKADPNKPVRTLKAKPGAASGPFHWNNRKFTEHELKRLQSFPDEFKFNTDSYTDIQRMIGNSVPPRMAYQIAKSIRKQTVISGDLIDSDTKLGFHSRRRTSSETYRRKANDRIEELYDSTEN